MILALLANWVAKAITAYWQLGYARVSREVSASVMERRRVITNSFIGCMGKKYNEVGRLLTKRVIGNERRKVIGK